jgi:hypothetical protein
LLAESVGERDAGKVASTVYGLTLLGAALAMSALWRHARSRNLVRPDVGDEEVVALTRKLTPGLAGYVAMIALGLFLPVVAIVGYLLIAVFFIVPIHRMRRSARPGA